MKKFYLSLLILASVAAPSKADWRKVGDLNNDGKLTINDVVRLVRLLNDNSIPKDITLLDVNEDNTVNKADVEELVNIILGKKEAKQIWTTITIPIGNDDDNVTLD